MSLTAVDDCKLFETPLTKETWIDTSSNLVNVCYLLQETVELYQIDPIWMVILLEVMEQHTCVPVILLAVPSKVRKDLWF